jgi:hypothetical protein
MNRNDDSVSMELDNVLTPVQSQSRRLVLRPQQDGGQDIKVVPVNSVGIPQKYLWRSCCMEFDSRAVVFFSQLIISTGVMMFCIYQLATHEDCETQKSYSSLLTFLIGIHLPAPKISSGV